MMQHNLPLSALLLKHVCGSSPALTVKVGKQQCQCAYKLFAQEMR